MKSKTKAFAILFTGIALAIGVAVSSGIIRNSFKVDESRALDNQSITINEDDFNPSLTQTATTFETISQKNIDFAAGGMRYNATNIYLNKSGGYLYNKTTFGSIVSVRINKGTGTIADSATAGLSFDSVPISLKPNTFAFTHTAGNASQTYSATTNSGYFRIDVTNASNFQFENLVVEFQSGPSGMLQSLSYSGTPTKTSYYAGESFDSSGMVITAHYDSSDTVVVTNDCTFTPNPLLAGTTDIQVAYNDGSNIVQLLIEDLIQVASRTLTSLQVTSNPTKMNYFVGDTFDPSGMVVAAHYDDESQVGDYKGYTYSPTGALNNLGSQLITITDSVDTLISTSVTIQVNEAPEIEDLFISEYIEGSSSNKAIEIFNGTNSTINLGVYSLKLYANGSSTPNTPILSLSGSLANGETYVVANASANASIQAVADITHAVTFFGGDDAIGLYKNDLLIDVIGEIGNDPGTAWTGKDANNNDASTAEMTLVRHPSILSPNTTFALSEWIAYATDTVTYLGSHTVNVSAPQYELDAIAWGASFISETATGCNEFDQAQLLTAWSGLATSFNALSSDAKNYLTTLTPNELGNDAQHAVARYLYIITKYGDVTFNDFMNLGISSSSNNTNEIGDNTPNVAIILIVSLVGASVLVGYRLMPKKKED